MTPRFSVRTNPGFDRLLRRLTDQHPELPRVFAEALGILETDPHNRRRAHSIRKLSGVGAGAGGQYRLRMGRFRFRYDIEDRKVLLLYCGLRREDTYG